MSKSETVAVLLSGTSFYLNLDEHAPARMMIEKGAAVALGSDLIRFVSYILFADDFGTRLLAPENDS